MSQKADEAARHLEWVAGVRRERLDEAAHWTEMTREAVRKATAGGMSESEAARLSGVTRMTIRKWVGK